MYTEKVYLRWGVALRIEQGNAVAENSHFVCHFDQVEPERFLAVANHLNGRTVPDTAAALNESPGFVDSVLKALQSTDLVYTDSDRPIDGRSLYKTCASLFPSWKEALFSHPLWSQLANGQASDDVFAGWILETWHFIEGANLRMPLAIAHAKDRNIRDIFAHHYREEWNHGEFFLLSLESMGYKREDIYRARPLSGTQMVIDHMRACARRDELEYATCSGFLESTGKDRTRARDFYVHLSEHYGEHWPHAIKPMADHVALDEDYGHGMLLEQICDNVGPLSRTRANNALQAAWTLVEVMQAWSSDILTTYGGGNRYKRIQSEWHWPANRFQKLDLGNKVAAL